MMLFIIESEEVIYSLVLYRSPAGLQAAHKNQNN